MTNKKSNRAARQQRAHNARERAAVARQEQKRAAQVHRAQQILSAVIIVVLIAAAVVYVAIKSGSTHHSEASTPVPAAVLSEVTSVPQPILNDVARGTSEQLLKPVTDDSLVVGGKPDFFFVGAEYCPFCAGERWAIVQALSRFGTFSGLRAISSSEQGYPTFDFRNASYTSKYLSFSPREIQDQSHHTLQSLTPPQQLVYKKYVPNGGVPFWYLSGGFQQSGAGYDVGQLGGKTMAEVASGLSNPADGLSKSIIGEANVITAAICKATSAKPAAVCAAPAVTLIKLPS
jgi:hypothetical protein